MLRRVAAFCRPLRPVLLLVSFPRSRSPVVGVLGLCWMWRGVPFACQRRPHQKNFSPGKMKFIEGAGNLRPILGTQTSFWPLTHPPPLLQGLLKQQPEHKEGVSCPVCATAVVRWGIGVAWIPKIGGFWGRTALFAAYGPGLCTGHACRPCRADAHGRTDWTLLRSSLNARTPASKNRQPLCLPPTRRVRPTIRTPSGERNLLGNIEHLTTSRDASPATTDNKIRPASLMCPPSHPLCVAVRQSKQIRGLIA